MDSPNGDGAAKDPFLPPMIKVGDIVAPKAPTDMADITDEKDALFDMGVKLAATVARFNTEWVSKQLRLSMPLTRSCCFSSLPRRG